MNRLRKIRGKFWLVQSHTINPEYANDRFGRPTVNWPGRSIHTTRQSAEDTAKRLSELYDSAFFVMEAISMFERPHVITKETKL